MKTIVTLEETIRAAQIEAGDGEDWEYGQPAVLQRLIDNGTVWCLEGSAGRAASQALAAGVCFLPEHPCRDYWGNRVPARQELQAGTKGTLENAARYWGLEG